MGQNKNESSNNAPVRVKVMILCKACKEKFIFKGVKIDNTIDTGFKRCLCGNETEFHMEIL
jgi:hypothetical protein